MEESAALVGLEHMKKTSNANAIIFLFTNIYKARKFAPATLVVLHDEAYFKVDQKSDRLIEGIWCLQIET